MRFEVLNGDGQSVTETEDELRFPSCGEPVRSRGRSRTHALLVSFSWAFDAQQTFITVFTDAQLPPPSSSIISEWALKPEDPLLTGLPASSFFMGCLVGGLALSTLADTTVGRKNMLFFSTLLMSLSSFLAAFAPDLWAYSSLKFLIGFGRATIGTSALVLATEAVGKQRRGQVGVLGFICFTLGFLSLPAMAYLNRNSSWRNLYLYTSIPTFFYSVLVKLLARESPRWLLVQGRKEEAISTLKSMASISQNTLSLAISKMSHIEENSNGNVYLLSAIRALVHRKWALRRILAIMAMGIGIGLVYYGMPLGLASLSFNLYLSVTFNALSELPSSLLTFVLIDKFNRRSALWVFTMLSGIFSVLSVVEMKVLWTTELQIAFELVSFFSACTSFNIYLIYTTELFPTCVRNSALAMARQAVVLGGAFSPMLVAAGKKGRFGCYGVFGLVIGLSGVFAVCLPETHGRALCDTMDEEEEEGEKEKFDCDVLA
ncbi:organic cation/carnitine transporter 3-like [Senna tora]|uniref:Organic cation/carnitine transporter 3-like n=1 Tax=Senna tora TaxID=362788 RepID=A0A834W5X1_9FABA|nr:organic cation/carnitine transporter 3-like [Senna tora]